MEINEMINGLVSLIDIKGGIELHSGMEEILPDGTKISHDYLIDNIGAKARLTLSAQHKIIVEHDSNRRPCKIFKRGVNIATNAVPASNKPIPVATANIAELTYLTPNFYPVLLLNFKCARDYVKYSSKNILLYGAKGSGKTSCVRKIVEDAGFGRVYQQNGTRDMTSNTFLGSPTLLIDETSMQSYVSFKKGPLYMAMIHGTELDDAGNQILYNKAGDRVYDESGQPKVISAPALYFLDEFSVVLPEIFTSVFNRALEIPDMPGLGRSLEIAEDGGRVVKSHPGFAVCLGSNLLGKGIESDEQSGYTGQNNQHDDSTLDRIDAVYEFGYNLQAEKNIMSKLLVNDVDVSNLTRFVDKIRKEWSLSTIETLFSTRQLLQLCKQIRLYRDSAVSDPIGRAFFDTVFSSLRSKEVFAWNQSVNMFFNTDILRAYSNNNTMVIPRKQSSVSI